MFLSVRYDQENHYVHVCSYILFIILFAKLDLKDLEYRNDNLSSKP